MKITLSKILLILISGSILIESFNGVIFEITGRTLWLSIPILVTALFGVVLGVISLFEERILKGCLYIVWSFFVFTTITLLVEIVTVNNNFSVITFFMILYWLIYLMMAVGFWSSVKAYRRRNVIMTEVEIKWFDGEKLV